MRKIPDRCHNHSSSHSPGSVPLSCPAAGH